MLPSFGFVRPTLTIGNTAEAEPKPDAGSYHRRTIQEALNKILPIKKSVRTELDNSIVQLYEELNRLTPKSNALNVELVETKNKIKLDEEAYINLIKTNIESTRKSGDVAPSVFERFDVINKQHYPWNRKKFIEETMNYVLKMPTKDANKLGVKQLRTIFDSINNSTRNIIRIKQQLAPIQQLSSNLSAAVQAKFPDTVPRESFAPELVPAFGKMKVTMAAVSAKKTSPIESTAAAAASAKKSSSSKSSSDNSEDARYQLEMINENSGHPGFADMAATRSSLATEAAPWTVNGGKTKRRRRKSKKSKTMRMKTKKYKNPKKSKKM